MKTFNFDEINDLYTEYINQETLRVGNAFYFKSSFKSWLQLKFISELLDDKRKKYDEDLKRGNSNIPGDSW